MILKVYSIYDSAVQVWRSPLFARAKGEILRSFVEAVNKPDTEFAKNPSDYILFELGSFDDSTGKFSLYDAPDRVGVAIEFVNPSK